MEFQGLSSSEPQIGLECDGEIVRKITKIYESKDDNSPFTTHQEAYCIKATNPSFRLFPGSGLRCKNTWVFPTVEKVKYLKDEIEGEVWTCPRHPKQTVN